MRATDRRTQNNKGRGMALTHYPSMDALTDIHDDRILEAGEIGKVWQ